MRVLLWYWGRRGGGARITLELAAAMRDCIGVVPLLAVAEANELHDELRALGIPLRADRVPLTAATAPGPWSLGAWARREQVDVAVQVMGHVCSAPVMLGMRAAGVPTVDHVHDPQPHPGDVRRLYDLSTRWSTRMADEVIALSEYARDALVGSGRVEASRVSVVPHGPLYAAHASAPAAPVDGARISAPVDGARISVPVDGARITAPVDGARITAPPTALFFGRIRAYKGLDLLLDAWSQVHAAVAGAVLVVRGEGDLAPYGPRLAALAAAGCDVRVEQGWVADRDVPAVVGAADVLVLPYREASQSGVATIAASLGVRVVATDVGGLREQVPPTVGEVCAAEPGAIAAAVVRALTDATVSPDAGVGHVESGAAPSWHAVAEATVEVARRAIRRRAGSDRR